MKRTLRCIRMIVYVEIHATLHYHTYSAFSNETGGPIMPKASKKRKPTFTVTHQEGRSGVIHYDDPKLSEKQKRLIGLDRRPAVDESIVKKG